MEGSMVNAEDFKRLMHERDAEVGDVLDYYDEYRAWSLLLGDSHRTIRLFDGSEAFVVEVLDNYKADYDGDYAGSGWDYSYANGEVAIVKHVTADGTETYFKVDAWLDSWDNGKDDVWIVKEVVPVRSVVKTTWEEVK